MAYGLKYFGTGNTTKYNNNPTRELKIEFWFKDYTGTSSEVRLGGSPFVEKQRGTDDIPYGINDSRYSIQIISQTLGVNDFYLEEDRSVLIKLVDITDTPYTVRECYLIAEDAKESYEDGLNTIELTATDGLELLKSIEYLDFQGKVFAGRNNVLWILTYCLSKIGLCANVNTTFNYRTQGSSTLSSFEPLVFMELSHEIFADDNCFDVLEKIATTLNCKIFQEDGEWWFAHMTTKDDYSNFVRKWSLDPTNLLSHGTLSDSLTVEFDGTYRPVGNKNTSRSNNKVISTVSLLKYNNKVPNPTFQNGDIDGWNVSQVDSYSRGGLGTKLEPYYLQINGYQPSGVFEASNIKGVTMTTPITIFDRSLGVEPEVGLNKTIKINGSVLGNDVTDVFVTLILSIQSDSLGWNNLLNGVLNFYLNSSGEWVWLEGETSTSIIPKISEYANIKVSLLDSDGKNKEKFTNFDVDSANIAGVTIKQGWMEYILNNKAYKVNSSDFDRAKLTVILSEGYGRTKDPQGVSYNPWVRYANMNLEIVDKAASLGVLKNRYVNDQKKALSKELEIDKYFCDFVDNEQSVAITESGVSTKNWTNGENNGELLPLLNKELISLTGKPLQLFDGYIIGNVKKWNRIIMLDYEEKLIPLSFNYDFFDNRLNSVRYLKGYGSYLSSTELKLGVYSDDREVPYDDQGDFVGGEVNDLVPQWRFDSDFILNIGEQSLFSGGVVNINKTTDSGINWFNETTGVVSDYIKPSADGFLFKSESSPFTANLTFANLTADTTITLPNSGTVITDETGWLLTANALTAKGYLGSTTNFDVGFKRNDIEYFTLNTDGISVLKDITTSGNITLQKGNPRLRLRDTGAGGHTGGFDLHVNGDEFLIDDNTHSRNILRNYLNSSVHTTDFDADVFNFKNGTTNYARLNATSLNLPYLTPSQLIATDASDNLVSLSTATYPSLTELTYLKGVTSSIQTQINAKFILPSLTSGSVLFSNGTTIAQNNAQLFWDNTNTRLGIGTTSPRAKLDVVGGTALFYNTAYLSATPPTTLSLGYQSTGISFVTEYSQGTNSGKMAVITHELVGTGNGHLHFETYQGGSGGGKRMSILNNGNVGIGTTSPAELLHVNGTSRTINLKITNGATVGYAWKCTNADGSGAWESIATSERWKGNWDASSGVAPSASPTIGDYYSVIVAGTYMGVTFPLNSYAFYDGTSWVFRPNGYTLITATSSILGGIKIGSGLSIDGSGVVSVATLNQNTTGSAGSLTTARTIALTGDATWSVNFNGTVDVTAGLTLATVNSNVGTFNNITVNAKGLVTAASNVSYQSPLSGTGFMSANGSTISYSKNINLENTTFANQNGVIQKNGVAWIHDFNYGTYNSVNTIGQNIFIGSSNFVSGKFASQTWHGSYNVAVGGNSLLANNVGAYNSSLGHNSLYSNTGGSNNVAVGYNSLYKNIDGSSNVSLGYNSLYNNIDGGDNIAIGYYSMYNNTSGVRNISIGSSSLASNDTGNFNIAIGDNSLSYNQTGSNNIAIGLYAMSYNVTGVYNTAIGTYSLLLNSTGENNTANGYYSLRSNTTGFNNTGIGYNSGYDLTTGSNNVFIGYNSGLGITTGSNNIVIGANTTGLSSSLSNYIILGDNAGFRRFVINDLGNAGLGLDNPLYKLHVNGDIKSDANLIVDGFGSFGLTNPLTISQKDYIQGATTAYYNEITSTGKWLRLNTDSGFSLRHNEIDAISFDNDSWKFNTTFKVVQGEEISDWTGFNIDDRFRMGINDNTGLATFEMVYENSIVRNFFNEEGVLSHIDTSGSVRKYLREGDIIGGGTSIVPNLQQVTEQGANSTLRMQFNGVNYATMSDLGTTQGLDSVLSNGNTANNKNIFLNGLSGAYTLGYNGSAVFYINHSSEGILNMTQTTGSQFNINSASAMTVTSQTSLGINSGADLNLFSEEILKLTSVNGLKLGTSDTANTEVGSTSNYLVLNGQKYNLKLPSKSSGAKYLFTLVDYNTSTERIDIQKINTFVSGGQTYLVL